MAKYPEQPLMPPSRPRLRSNTGCIQCRRRRKKCCEQRPVCNHCRRIGLICSFSNPPAPVPDSAGRLDTDILSSGSQPSVIAFRHEMTTVRIVPVMGQSKEICALLQHHSVRDSLDSCLPTVPRCVLLLLPLVADDTMALAAVTAILALFMPLDWIQRSQSPLRLSQQAVRELSAALADCPLATACDEVMITASLLYLFQLHWESVAIQACSHLKAVGIMLQHRLQSIELRSLPPTPSLEAYLYHMIVTSTVNFEVVPPDVTPSTIAIYFKQLSSQQGCPITDLTLLGISAPLLLGLFHLSWLRREVLLHPQRASTWSPTYRSDQALCFRRSGLPIESAYLDILYIHACSLFRSLILDQVTTSNGLPNTKYRQRCDELELKEAIHFVYSVSMPYHVTTWPLLVIGLASRAGDLREKIAECFKRLIGKSRLRSAASPFEVLKAAWDAHYGLSILLSPTLETMLVF